MRRVLTKTPPKRERSQSKAVSTSNGGKGQQPGDLDESAFSGIPNTPKTKKRKALASDGDSTLSGLNQTEGEEKAERPIKKLNRKDKPRRKKSSGRKAIFCPLILTCSKRPPSESKQIKSL